MEVHVKFNSWELESSSGAWLDLRPSSAPHDHGADWWSAEVTVPSDAYEMNYIFSDGVGTTDNNGGLDYLSEVDGHMTRQAWTEAAPERMVQSTVLIGSSAILPCIQQDLLHGPQADCQCMVMLLCRSKSIPGHS